MTRVWVTRDEPPGGPLCRAVAGEGLEPVHEPVLETATIGDAAPEIAALRPGDWLVLTSPRAIRAVAVGPARLPRVAVVGAESERAARSLGLRVEFVSPTGSGEGVWTHLARHARGLRVCYPRSSLAEVPALPGVEIIAPVLYDTRPRAFDRSVGARIDVVAVASPSAVRSIRERLGSLPAPAASIGPTTSEAVREAGGVLLAEAPERTLQALARAIASAVGR